MQPPGHSVVRLLEGWLPRQRWFGGKHIPIDGITIGTATELHPGDPALHHLVLDVRQQTSTDHYQLLLGTRRNLPDRLRPHAIGRLPGLGHLYDAAHDPELTRPLLEHLAGQTTIGPLRFRAAPGVEIQADLDGVPVSAEQSNTSLIYGGTYICKLFRRLSPGVNPDLEVNLALTRAGCVHVPAVRGWIELEPDHGVNADGEPATLALLSEFMPTATDGWSLALTSVRDWYAQPAGASEPVPGAAGGDFAGEAERLGAATAQVHRDLAAAFGVTPAPAGQMRALVQGMAEQLDQVGAAVPALRPHAPAIRAAFERAGAAATGAADAPPLPLQRVHGDYHLGQVLRTGAGWVVLDFEGEPARPPAERRALAHPLRDVAGMLRSFDYAARFLLAGEDAGPPEAADALERRAQAWAERNRDAFCAGYVGNGGADPAAHAALLRAFELDKAVYEVRYEARNRPSWVSVPLRSLAYLAG
ncbi:phosphotransferase [Actinomadura sp. NEAU-AAG7]|uniref:maltokinase N-terminal cap-like domain-containing protein n=1 Tax=Actinomadura sp. NEAU-AAG7 TaxID=2839640 RepID=UPI001BE41567|nr:phosphotransferase [Actinomadura sp. NEAU-AAG7]MBT2208318.1 phosphotransferase [Actinomadura sp. NEAU-AAG7]